MQTCEDEIQSLHRRINDPDLSVGFRNKLRLRLELLLAYETLSDALYEAVDNSEWSWLEEALKDPSVVKLLRKYNMLKRIKKRISDPHNDHILYHAVSVFADTKAELRVRLQL